MADGTSITTRSALEARWAILFTELGLLWEYEPFRLGAYLPDFRVEKLGFVEIKPTLDLLIAESSVKISKVCRDDTSQKVYAFCGEHVSFDTVALYQHNAIFAPTHKKMIQIFREITAIPTSFTGFNEYGLKIEIAMNRANRAKLDHFVSVGKVLELETIPQINQVRRAQ
jgi:hypothetical protein